jgi:hypothetical protein
MGEPSRRTNISAAIHQIRLLSFLNTFAKYLALSFWGIVCRLIRKGAGVTF